MLGVIKIQNLLTLGDWFRFGHVFPLANLLRRDTIALTPGKVFALSQTFCIGGEALAMLQWQAWPMHWHSTTPEVMGNGQGAISSVEIYGMISSDLFDCD